MVKKFAFSLVVFLLMVFASSSLVVAQAPGDRTYSYCNPFASSLCNGLIALYEFEEGAAGAAWPRTSETGSAYFLEPNNSFIASSAVFKTGAKSFPHAANATTYLYIPKSVGFTGNFTMSFWIRVSTGPSADTKVSRILSMRTEAGSDGYPYVALYRSGTSTYVRYYVKQALTDTVTYVQSSAVITTNDSAWHSVTFGQYSTPTTTEPYQQTLWLEVDAGTRTTATITYPDVPTAGDLRLGEWSNTSPREYCAYKIDQLAAWAGTFSPSDVDVLYNGGAGKNYPFN